LIVFGTGRKKERENVSNLVLGEMGKSFIGFFWGEVEVLIFSFDRIVIARVLVIRCFTKLKLWWVFREYCLGGIAWRLVEGESGKDINTREKSNQVSSEMRTWKAKHDSEVFLESSDSNLECLFNLQCFDS
jgi:hypothetical protein